MMTICVFWHNGNLEVYFSADSARRHFHSNYHLHLYARILDEQVRFLNFLLSSQDLCGLAEDFGSSVGLRRL